MSIERAISSGAFEARYAERGDPWSFADSPYERSRYEATLSALSRRRYTVTYEPGCSIGVLTHELAARSERVIATDFAPSAVEQARLRCAGCSNVELSCADLRISLPGEALELIIFSEIGYYFCEDELARIALALARRMTAQGEFVAVHWLGHSADHLLHGDRVHEILHEVLPLQPVLTQRHPGFLLNTWRRS